MSLPDLGFGLGFLSRRPDFFSGGRCFFGLLRRSLGLDILLDLEFFGPGLFRRGIGSVCWRDFPSSSSFGRLDLLGRRPDFFRGRCLLDLDLGFGFDLSLSLLGLGLGLGFGLGCRRRFRSGRGGSLNRPALPPIGPGHEELAQPLPHVVDVAGHIEVPVPEGRLEPVDEQMVDVLGGQGGGNRRAGGHRTS